jgi:hypothetical protein
MYILTQEPQDSELADAFDVLDEVVGAEEFTESQALGALTEAFEEDARKLWSRLKAGEYVSEV